MPGAQDLDPGDSIEQYLGNMVREARLTLGREWTQAYLAKQVFSSGTRISEIERGEDPRTGTWRRSWRSSCGSRPVRW